METPGGQDGDEERVDSVWYGSGDMLGLINSRVLAQHLELFLEYFILLVTLPLVIYWSLSFS